MRRGHREGDAVPGAAGPQVQTRLTFSASPLQRAGREARSEKREARSEKREVRNEEFMSELRNQLESARDRYRTERYAGDLAEQLLGVTRPASLDPHAKTDRRSRWRIGLA